MSKYCINVVVLPGHAFESGRGCGHGFSIDVGNCNKIQRRNFNVYSEKASVEAEMHYIDKSKHLLVYLICALGRNTLAIDEVDHFRNETPTNGFKGRLPQPWQEALEWQIFAWPSTFYFTIEVFSKCLVCLMEGTIGLLKLPHLPSPLQIASPWVFYNSSSATSYERTFNSFSTPPLLL